MQAHWLRHPVCSACFAPELVSDLLSANEASTAVTRHDQRSLPIGVFDSGVGGLTVARAIIDLLPHEPLVYVGDTARFPYGPKPVEEIKRYALEVADYLITVTSRCWWWPATRWR